MAGATLLSAADALHVTAGRRWAHGEAPGVARGAARPRVDVPVVAEGDDAGAVGGLCKGAVGGSGPAGPRAGRLGDAGGVAHGAVVLHGKGGAAGMAAGTPAHHFDGGAAGRC